LVHTSCSVEDVIAVVSDKKIGSSDNWKWNNLRLRNTITPRGTAASSCREGIERHVF
jgi:hypothetical protein